MRQLGRSWLALALLVVLSGAVLAPAASSRAASTTDYVANCSFNLRSSASTSATALATLPSQTVVTASGTVTGSSWGPLTCVTSVLGNTWYAITAVNGKSVSSLYGVNVAYAATGLFTASLVAGAYLEGIDVSGWQGTIDFGKVKGAGKSFVIAKATEGIGFTDSGYATNKSGATAAGLAFTGYHFARPDLNPTNPTGEADWFLGQLGLTPGMLVPALDLEKSGKKSDGTSFSVTDLQNWVAAWLGEVYAKTGVRAMIYTSPAFWNKYMGNTTMFADQGYTVLWVAHWFVKAPAVPANNWGGHGWTFWQYDDCGSVPGISGCVDLDRYNGTDLTAVTYDPDFKLAESPTSQSVKQGVGTSFSISITRTGFTLPIDLSVSGLPNGATGTIDPSTTSGSSATLMITTSKSGSVTPVGTYPLTVTGTGGGLTHTVTATLVVKDGIPPTVTAPTSRLITRPIGSTTTPVVTYWSASDPSGIASYKLQRSVNGGGFSTITLSSATSTSVIQSLAFGYTYRYRLSAVDGAGNVASYVYGPSFRPYLLQQSSSAIKYSGTWYTAYATSYSGGSVKYATVAGAWASYTFSGYSIGWVAEKGPTRGSAKVYLDGVYKTTVSLYASWYQAARVVYRASWGANGTHTIRIVVVGTAGHPRVDVDAFVRLVQV